MKEVIPEDDWKNRRRQPRKYLLFKIPAYDAESRRFLGQVQDINETGLQLLGVKVEINSTRNIVVQVADFPDLAPVGFAAKCRWCRRESPQGYYASGFEITAIGDEARRNLIDLIDLIALG